MKRISEKVLPNGNRRVVVELGKSEELVPIHASAHYKMGYPHDDIVHADHILQARQVTWCVIEQKWVE